MNKKKLIQPKRRKKKNKFVVWCKDWYITLEIIILSFLPTKIKKDKNNYK